ncbi:hypothetical protein TSTA_069130 [Talaromyces stipitatus ATCC 10500]|uniref:Uncharacterized protein n=1 Tax=Talaromyces stipitatus (strain ATCC 10500 / CBS 375.48 / QM 6759 / NRRL 1006) TaxID=441959 RepID=B8LYY4_TALSN|nr:uncharacterized protein TSTA_069130 [Talaromyces stipitatus ATCC 10500]EED23492.1 hypothetical protein TSTA_069130 [Talaromyces stipitatus ATCC 10500]
MVTRTSPNTPLHIYYHQSHENLKVVDGNSNTTLYIINRSLTEPHLTILHASSGSGKPTDMAGTVSMDDEPTDISLCFPDREFKMTLHDRKADVHWVAGPGIKWKWKHQYKKNEDLEAIDMATGRWLAKFEIASSEFDKKGTIVLSEFMLLGQSELDVLVVTALARNEYDRRVRKKNREGVVHLGLKLEDMC